MKTRAITLCIFTLTVLTSAAWCQTARHVEDKIWVGMELKLGLPKDAVIGQLAESYTLEKNGTVDNWFVKSKAAPFDRLGLISFTNGKLSCATRLWSGGEDSDFAFVNVLHGVLDQFKKEGKSVCSISTDSNRKPEYEERFIKLQCGAKMLIIQTDEFLAKDATGKSSTAQSSLIEEVLFSKGTNLCSTF